MADADAERPPAHVRSEGPRFARATVEVALLGMLVLAGTTLLLRKQEHEPEEGSGTDSATGEQLRSRAPAPVA